MISCKKRKFPDALFTALISRKMFQKCSRKGNKIPQTAVSKSKQLSRRGQAGKTYTRRQRGTRLSA